MRRFKGLQPQICDVDHLRRSLHLAARGKRRRSAVAAALFNADAVLRQLQRELAEGRWRPHPVVFQRVYDPKPRLIAVAPFRDRVVHHGIFDVLEPLLGRSYLPESYACLKGKGTHRAILQVRRQMVRHRQMAVADIRKYFPSIPHGRLLALMEARIADPWVVEQLRRILQAAEGIYLGEEVRTFLGDPLFSPERHRGLPIGALGSQVWGNAYLDGLDHYIKRDLKVPGYVRYMDNLTLFGESRAELRGWIRLIEEWLRAERGLTLRGERTQLLSCAGEVTYLGFKVSRRGQRLAPQTLERMERRLGRRLSRRYPGTEEAYLEQALLSWKGAEGFTR